MEFNRIHNHKRIIAIGIIALTLIAGLWLFFRKTQVTVIVSSPVQGTVFFDDRADGSPLKAEETIFHLESGVHTVRIITNEFSPYTTTINFNRSPYSFAPQFSQNIVMKRVSPPELITLPDSFFSSNRHVLDNMPTDFDVSFMKDIEGDIFFAPDSINALVRTFANETTDETSEIPPVMMKHINTIEQSITNTDCSMATWLDENRFLCGRSGVNGALDVYIVSSDSEQYITTLYDISMILMYPDPTGNHVAIVSMESYETSNLYLLALTEKTIRKITYDNYVDEVKWSRDGTALLYSRASYDVDTNYELWKYNLETDETLMLNTYDISYFALRDANHAYIVVPETSKTGNQEGETAISMLEDTFKNILMEELSSGEYSDVENFSFLKTHFYNVYLWDIPGNKVTFLTSLMDDSEYVFTDILYTYSGTLRAMFGKPLGVTDAEAPLPAEFVFVDVTM